MLSWEESDTPLQDRQIDRQIYIDRQIDLLYIPGKSNKGVMFRWEEGDTPLQDR